MDDIVDATVTKRGPSFDGRGLVREWKCGKCGRKNEPVDSIFAEVHRQCDYCEAENVIGQ